MSVGEVDGTGANRDNSGIPLRFLCFLRFKTILIYSPEATRVPTLFLSRS